MTDIDTRIWDAAWTVKGRRPKTFRVMFRTEELCLKWRKEIALKYFNEDFPKVKITDMPERVQYYWTHVEENGESFYHHPLSLVSDEAGLEDVLALRNFY